MKLHYYPETDSLYIDLADRPGVDSQEIAPGVVLDFDDAGQLVGIDIDRASQVVNLTRLEAESLPITSFALSQDPNDVQAAR
jgi:uncharacterized protein YuzE